MARRSSPVIGCSTDSPPLRRPDPWPGAIKVQPTRRHRNWRWTAWCSWRYPSNGFQRRAFGGVQGQSPWPCLLNQSSHLAVGMTAAARHVFLEKCITWRMLPWREPGIGLSQARVRLLPRYAIGHRVSAESDSASLRARSGHPIELSGFPRAGTWIAPPRRDPRRRTNGALRAGAYGPWPYAPRVTAPSTGGSLGRT